MIHQRILPAVLMVFLLTSCAWSPRETRDVSIVEEINDELSDLNSLKKSGGEKPANSAVPPEQVSNALLPSLPAGGLLNTNAAEETFDVYVDALEARDFFVGLVKDTAFNMVVHPEVEGKISLELSNVSIDEVMEVTREVYGYPYKKRGRLYQVMPGGLRSEVFQLDYLSLKRRGVSETQVTNGNVTDAGVSNTGDNSEDSDDSSDSTRQQGTVGAQIRTETEADFWSELQQTLLVLVGSGDGRSVVVTPQAGIVVVRAKSNELELVRDYLRRAELIMRRQVVLEAKIMEVELSDGYQTGINWSKLAEPGGDSAVYSMTGTSPETPGNAGGLFGVSYDTSSFAGVIELLESQGSVQVLSSPRISTVNNQKAVIKVGQDEFFVTDISNTTTTSTGTTTNNPEVELTPFFSGIALDVTPQISENDEIILHIHPSISEVSDQTKTINLGGQLVELPLALSTIRETDSIVFAKSGQVIVLGGLMQNRSSDSNAGTPLLGQLPILGHLFSQQRNATVKSELVILLKPVIMGPNGSPADIERSRQRFDQFRRTLGKTWLDTVTDNQ